MPKKSSVSLTLRITREDAAQELTGTGTLHQLVTGWAIACRLKNPEGEESASNAAVDCSMGANRSTSYGASVQHGHSSDGAADDDHGTMEMTLTIRKDEIRMNRGGAVKQEQLFRVGQWQRGTIDTAFGRLETEAMTYRLQVSLAASGGTVEWEYDLRAADQMLGRSVVKLLVREENDSRGMIRED